MRTLALDIGSSSVKAALLQNGKIVGGPTRAAFDTTYGARTAEVDVSAVLRAVRSALSSLPRKDTADIMALCAMAPSWLAMDRKGRPLTPIITHQDRRSIDVARELEHQLGTARLLRVTGNRPFPGGISSTTAAWFARNHKTLLRQADLAGHLNTFLLRRWTDARVTDPSNASFMGLYRTTRLNGWDPEIAAAIGIGLSQLPDVLVANQVAGTIIAEGARELGVKEGTPVLPGIMDTSAAVLLRGARPGMLFNVSGSTDVLALCVNRPRPHPQLLTRATGVGKSWMAVSTLASAGTTLTWLRQTLFGHMTEERFFALVGRTLRAGHSGGVTFQPYLAGDRMSIDQRLGEFSGLSLSTSREQMLYAALDAMAKASGQRLPLLRQQYGRISTRVLVAGGVGTALADVLHRDWPGQWQFEVEKEATLRGLAKLAEMGRG